MKLYSRLHEDIERKEINYVAYTIMVNGKIGTYITKINKMSPTPDNPNLIRLEYEGYDWGTYGRTKKIVWNFMIFGKGGNYKWVDMPKDFFFKKSGTVKLNVVDWGK